MLIAGRYAPRGEADRERALQLFANWTPPAGFAFTSHYARADGEGGVFVAEAASEAVLLEAVSPFAPFFVFDLVPVVEISEAVPIFMKTNAWRASIQ